MVVLQGEQQWSVGCAAGEAAEVELGLAVGRAAIVKSGWLQVAAGVGCNTAGRSSRSRLATVP